MRFCIVYVLFCGVLLLSTYMGSNRQSGETTPVRKGETTIPSIGSVEVLNGCGTTKAANAAASYLRDHGIDVKMIGNAAYWNYPFTIVVSRVEDMKTATEVAKILHTEKLIMARTANDLYDVSVYIGPDYGELLQ